MDGQQQLLVLVVSIQLMKLVKWFKYYAIPKLSNLNSKEFLGQDYSIRF